MDWSDWIIVGIIIVAMGVNEATADFGIPDEPGTDDQHLDNPRYVRLASNGSMLISDDHRILEVDAAGQIVWQIRGTFCDIEWVDNDTWAALNGTGAYTCDRIMFSDGRSINLSRDVHHLVRSMDGLIVASVSQNNWTTEVDLQGNVLHDCEFIEVVDIHPGYFVSRYDLYEYNLSTCSFSNLSDTPGTHVMSFYPMPNGSIVYAVGVGGGNFSIVWGNWSSDVGASPLDLDWNGTALASPIYYEHFVRVWNLSEPPPLDTDGDGVLDPDDDCPDDWGNATDLPGCPDTDGDGTSDVNDPCPTDPLDGCVDSDGDGWNDSTDDCPASWGNSTVDRLGCPDLDGDGISDLNDPCPDDPLDLCNQTQPDPDQLEIVSYDWNITNRTAHLLVLLNDTCDTNAWDGGAWSGSNPYTWTRSDLEPNTTYSFRFHFWNATSETWLNFTDTTLPDPENNTTADNLSWDPYVEWVHTETGNDSMWFNYWANETVTPLLNVQLDHSWYDLEGQQFQLSLSGLTPNTTYSISSTFYNEHNGSAVLWENFTTREAVYPWPPDGDGDHGGDGDPGLLDATPGGVPLTYILLSVVIVAGLSAAIFVGARPEREIRPPRVPAPLPVVPWADTDLDELEDPLEEVADPTIPLASPDLFAQLPELPAPGRMFLPEAPSPVPRDMPYLAIQVAEAEDLPMILESLKGRVKPEISEENHKVLKDVLDMEKRLRQLRDDRDIAGRQYEKLLQQVEDLKRAVQNLTPAMERRDWDV